MQSIMQNFFWGIFFAIIRAMETLARTLLVAMVGCLAYGITRQILDNRSRKIGNGAIAPHWEEVAPPCWEEEWDPRRLRDEIVFDVNANIDKKITKWGKRGIWGTILATVLSIAVSIALFVIGIKCL